jgi:hypothetical protein
MCRSWPRRWPPTSPAPCACAGLLRYACTGRLVPQDAADEPAGVLLQRIQAGRPAADPQAVRPRAVLPENEGDAARWFEQVDLGLSS